MADKDDNKKQSEKGFGKTETWFTDLVEHARELVQCVDSEGRFIYVNHSWLVTLKYYPEEMETITLWDIIHPDSMEHCRAVFKHVLTGKAYGEVEAIFVAKDGTPVLVEGNVNVQLDENSRFVHTRGIFRNVTERKRAENVNRLLFDISNAVVTVHSLDALYQSIHAVLGKVIDVTNFFIAIVDIQKRTLYFPYYVDTEDDDFQPITDFDPLRSLTGLVVSKGQPVLLKKEELDQRAQKGGVWGPEPLIWMGTPLMVEGEIIGAVAVQSYTDPDLYSEEDLKILAAVSDQMASAIARKRAEEELLSLKNFNESIIQTIQEGIIISDLNGMVTFANPALLKMLGYSSEEFIGSHWTDIVPPQYHTQIEAANSRRLEGKADRYELLLKHKNGTLLPVQVSGNPFYNYATGEIDGTMAVLTDISERKRSEEELKQSEEKYRTLHENIPIGVYRNTPGPEGRFLMVNPGFMQTFGIKTKEKLRQLKVMDLYRNPSDRASFSERLIAEGQVKGVELSLKRLDGTPLWGSITAQVVFDEHKEVAWFDCTIEDITQRKQAEELLNMQNAMLRTQLEVSPDGIFIVDENEKIISYNQKFCQIWGIPEEIMAHKMRKKAFDYVLPKLSDPDEFARRIQELYDNRQEKSYEEISLKDGRVLERYSAPMFGDEGQYYGRVWYYRDITDRKQAEETLQESEERLDLAMAVKNEGVWDKNLNTNKTYYDDRYYTMAGYQPGDFPQDSAEWEKRVHPEDLPLVKEAIAEHLNGKSAKIDIEYRFKKNDSQWMWVSDKGKVYERDASNKPVRIVGTHTDITDRKKAEEKISYLSFHDKLTGLYNRTFLEEEMKRLDTERQLPLTVIMADLNGLKLVNDTYGHKKGDEMLIAAAEIIKNSCRKEDIISRWGGDEFVILLPQTTSAEASLICKRITVSCQDAYIEEVPLSIALGMDTKELKTPDLMDFLREAEDEMYKRKLTESRSTKSAIVTSLLYTLAEKSYETEKHTREMQKIAQKVGTKLNLPDSELHRLELLITLHDIGKINISEAILTKEGSLTDEEWKEIVKHPEIGSRIAMATEEFAHVAEDILAHHERWDGSGYPQGLKGEVIPLLARITAIADAFEVMTGGRPYKKAMSKSEIIAEFKNCSGTHFDPELAETFLEILTNEG